MNSERLSKSAFIVIILVVAFSITPRITVGTLEYNRSLDLRYEDFLIVAILYFSVLAALKHRELPILHRTPITIPIALYVFISIISTIIGIFMGWINPTRALFYSLKEIEYFLIFFIVVDFIKNEKDILYTLWTIIFLGLLNNAFSFYQIITKDFFGGYGIALIGEVSPFGIGGYLSILAILSLCMFASGRFIRRGSRAILFITTISSLISLVHTGSRAFISGTIAALFFFLIMNREKRMMIIVAFLLVIVLVGYFGSALIPYFPVGASIIEERITNTEQIRLSVDIRVKKAYKPVLELISKNPFIGYGKSTAGTGDLPTEAHNGFLRILLEVGIPGLLIFLWLMYGILKMNIRLYRAKPSKYSEIVSMTCILSTISIVVASIFQDAFFPVKVGVLYWSLIGLAAVLVMLSDQPIHN